VTLLTPAPAGGLTVSLSSSLAVATVPASVTVPAGSTVASFTINTTPVPSTVSSTITATTGSSSKSVNLAIALPMIASFTVTPNPVAGGQTATGEIILTGPAPKGGITYALQSLSDSVSVRATVKVAAGETSVTFNVKTTTVPNDVTAAIKATYGETYGIAQFILTGS